MFKLLSGVGSIDFGVFMFGVGVDGLDVGFSGSIVGIGGLVKFGVGVFVLFGMSSFSGVIYIVGGWLVLVSVMVLGDVIVVIVDVGIMLEV